MYAGPAVHGLGTVASSPEGATVAFEICTFRSPLQTNTHSSPRKKAHRLQFAHRAWEQPRNQE